MNDDKPQVLLVSSHGSVARLISRMCATIGYSGVTIVSQADDMVSALDKAAYDVVLIDDNVDVEAPTDLLDEVRRARGGHKARTVLLTTTMTRSGVAKAAQAGVDAILLKPFSPGDLKSKLDVIQQRHRLAS